MNDSLINLNQGFANKLVWNRKCLMKIDYFETVIIWIIKYAIFPLRKEKFWFYSSSFFRFYVKKGEKLFRINHWKNTFQMKKKEKQAKKFNFIYLLFMQDVIVYFGGCQEQMCLNRKIFLHHLHMLNFISTINTMELHI